MKEILLKNKSVFLLSQKKGLSSSLDLRLLNYNISINPRSLSEIVRNYTSKNYPEERIPYKTLIWDNEFEKYRKRFPDQVITYTDFEMLYLKIKHDSRVGRSRVNHKGDTVLYERKKPGILKR